MSGEVDYRRSINPPSQLGRKYLSASLTPWYGTWAGPNITISYANLPPESGVLAKLICPSAGGYTAYFLSLNAVQNISGRQAEFWIRQTVGVAGTFRLGIEDPTGAGYYSAAIALPAIWTKYSLPNPNPTATMYASATVRSRCLVAARAARMTFDSGIAGAWTFEIAGMNIRRLP
jgi:hypothetical protein